MKTLSTALLLGASAFSAHAQTASLKTTALKACREAQQSLKIKGDTCAMSTIERRVLDGNIAEYSFTLQVGPGTYDKIGIHRVVKENNHGNPIHAKDAVFMVHGDAWGFRGAFLASMNSSAVADSHALPIYLAQNGVDVWGIDLRWTLVPASETNFAFMQNWGIGQDANDVGTGLAVARALRFASGSPFNKMHLLGWSRGGQIGYAYLNAESQYPAIFRHVKGFMPVDIYQKTDDADLIAGSCARAADAKTVYDGGTYQNTIGTLTTTAGGLALSAPAGASPIIPGFTNEQTALFIGSSTYALFVPSAPAPGYHFAAGTFSMGLPTGLQYQSNQGWFDFMTGASPYEPQLLIYEGTAMSCGTPNFPYDDNYADIKVPVQYTGAAGGFGDTGLYNLTLLGSTDVTSNIVSLHPAADRALDFGHADIFNASNAQTLAWDPMLTWILAH